MSPIIEFVGTRLTNPNGEYVEELSELGGPIKSLEGKKVETQQASPTGGCARILVIELEEPMGADL